MLVAASWPAMLSSYQPSEQDARKTQPPRTCSAAGLCQTYCRGHLSASQHLHTTQIEKCKALLRATVKFCDEAEGDKAIPEDAFDEDGELEACDIFCAKCLSKDSHDARSLTQLGHNGV